MSKTNRVEVLQPELKVPENNLIERKLSKALYYLGRVVQSQIHRKRFESDQKSGAHRGVERSLLNRRIRKELRDKLLGIRESVADKETRRKMRLLVSWEAKERDRLEIEYLEQKVVHVDMGELGMLSSRFTILNPPEDVDEKNLPPVVLIPGISNDIDPVAGLAQELAFSGRQVIVVAYPESTLGQITDVFADKVKEDGRFKYHADYFAEAIKTIKAYLGLDSFELWSHSTGGPISAELIRTHPELAASIQNAVLVSPAASVTQSMSRFATGLIAEVARDMKKYHINLSKFSLVMPEVKSELKDKVFQALLEAINKQYEHWEEIRLPGEQSQVVIWSGEKDTLTNTAQNTVLGKASGQKLIVDSTGTHLKGLLEPRAVITQVDSQMSR